MYSRRPEQEERRGFLVTTSKHLNSQQTGKSKMKLTDDIYAELNEIENKLTQKIAKDRKRKSIHN